MDLWGRLSNPPEVVETLAEQGSRGPRSPLTAVDGTRNRGSDGLSGAVPEEKGRLSNPVQRRLSDGTVDDLVRAYFEGSSIDAVARLFRINRTTVSGHLERRGVERRRFVRKMTDRSVGQAATCYESGESLKIVAARFGVDARTLAREFKQAGFAIRPRNGWPR